MGDNESKSIQQPGADTDNLSDPIDTRESGMRVEVIMSVGYRRIRPNTLGDKWEARIDSTVLLIGGILFVLLVVIFIIPKIIAAL